MCSDVADSPSNDSVLPSGFVSRLVLVAGGTALSAWLPVSLSFAIGLASLSVPSSALGSGGQCVWEGGPGAPTYAYCAKEDCIGSGGFAQCTTPVVLPTTSDERSDGSKWEYSYGDCPAYGPWGPAWCNASGGTWSGGQCTNLPPGHNSMKGANSETIADTTSDAFADIIYENPPSCSVLNVVDTGWGFVGGNPSCPATAPTLVNGIPTRENKYRTYTVGGQSCNGELLIAFTRTRKVQCPHNYFKRTKPNGDLHCYIPAECCDLVAGNPVSVVSGAKTHQETDYVSGGDNPLELRRYYNNKGFFRPLGGAPDAEGLKDYWRHTYDRQIFPVSSNPNLIAIAQRPDGSVRHFDGSGDEVLNRNGGGDEIVNQVGVGWTLTLANGDEEQYDTAGRLSSMTTRSGLTTTITRDASNRIATVTDHFGKQLSFAYDADDRLTTVTDPASQTITYAYDDEDRLLSVTYQDATVKTYHYEDTRGTHWLTGITDENLDRFSTYAYNQFGQVTLENHAGGVYQHTFTYYTYSSYLLTVVTDPLGLSRYHRTANQAGVYKLMDIDQNCTTCGSIKYAIYDANGNATTRRNFRSYQTTYVYDAATNLETSRTEGKWMYGSGNTPEMRTISTTWDLNHRLPDVITETDRITDNDYDVDGNLTQRTITDAATSASRVWAYSYNTLGQILTEDGPRTDVSDITTYTYYACSSGGECGQLYTITNAAGHTTTFDFYDAHGRPTQVTDPNGLITTIAYNLRGNVLSRTVGSETTTYAYDDAQQVTRETQPDGSYIDYRYDAAHRLTEIEDQHGNRTVYTLDGLGNRIAEDTYDPTSALVRTLSRTYNNRGRLITETGANNQTWTYAYDVNGNVTSTVDPLSRTTSYTYDPLDRVKTVTDPDLFQTTYGYDKLDNVVSVTDPRSVVTTYEYDGWGGLIEQDSPDTGLTTISRDQAGSEYIRTDARSISGISAYDVLQRVTGTTYPDQTIGYTYDAGINQAGRLTALTDVSGTTSWSYDLHGRPVQKDQTVNGLLRTVNYGYNTAGQLASIVTPSGQQIDYSYTNNHLTQISVNSQILLHSASYEPFGPVGGWTWGNGTQTDRQFDQDGRVTTIIGPETTSRTWDDANRIVAVANSQDPSLDRSFAYDNLDRLATVAAPQPIAPSIGLSTTSANPGDVVAATISNIPAGGGFWVALSHTSNPVTTYMSWVGITPGLSSYVWNVTMPPYAGNYEVRLFQNSDFSLAAVSAAIAVASPPPPGQPTLTRSAGTAAPGDQVTVHLADGFGNPGDFMTFALVGAAPSSYVQQTYVGSGVTDRDWTVTMPATPGNYEFRLFLNYSYTLQTTSNPVTVTDIPPVSTGVAAGNSTFVYDAVGNRLNLTDDGGSSTYTYAASSNRLQSIAGAQARTYTYDLAGNTTAWGSTLLTYNGAGRLVTATSGGVTRDYFHNALGQRVRKKLSASDSIYYVYDEAGHLLGEYDTSGDLIQETVWLGDIPVATLRPAAGGGVDIFYVHTDHLNTPRLVSQASDNALRWRWDDQGFGTTPVDDDPNSLGTFDYELRFPGQYYDTETELHYNYFRDYDAAVGRYLESDPIGLRGGLNTYAYVSNSPFGAVDPTGLFTVTDRSGSQSGNDGGGVFCDGNGGLTAELFGEWSECVKDCALQHEQSHIEDIRSRSPSICSRVNRKARIGSSSEEERRWTERRAYLAELRCLRSKVENCDGCEPVVRNRMIFVREQIRLHL